MDTLLDQIAAKKAELDRLRPLAPHGLRNFEHSHDLELTYTSNAIEGNTLTAVETTQVTRRPGSRSAAKPSRIIWKPSIITMRPAMRASSPIVPARH